jgi:hypothetical protein
MSFTTTTQNLVGPTGDDLIVAAGDAVKDLALRTDARLDAQYANLGVSQVPPLTVIESTTAENLFSGFSPPWAFDTVLVDTQGGADLAADPRKINLTRTGYWMVGGYAEAGTIAGSVTTCFKLYLNVNVSPGGIQFHQASVSQVDGGHGLSGSCSTIARVDDATRAYTTLVGFWSGLTNSNYTGYGPVTKRRMWAYWLGDL